MRIFAASVIVLLIAQCGFEDSINDLPGEIPTFDSESSHGGTVGTDVQVDEGEDAVAETVDD